MYAFKFVIQIFIAERQAQCCTRSPCGPKNSLQLLILRRSRFTLRICTKVDSLAGKIDFLKPGPRKGMERAPEWSQELRGQFSGNLTFIEKTTALCVFCRG